MKPKIIAGLVVGLLTLSVVATGVAAIGQAVGEEPGSATTALAGLSSSGEDGGQQGDSKLVSTFKMVCPLH